jgi:hypothetical protein
MNFYGERLMSYRHRHFLHGEGKNIMEKFNLWETSMEFLRGSRKFGAFCLISQKNSTKDDFPSCYCR